MRNRPRSDQGARHRDNSFAKVRTSTHQPAANRKGRNDGVSGQSERLNANDEVPFPAAHAACGLQLTLQAEASVLGIFSSRTMDHRSTSRQLYD